MTITKPSKKSPRRPICIDLFSGVGGLSLGFEQAGFNVAAAIEIDPIHAAAHEFNFPHSTMVCSDIRKVTGDSIRKESKIGAQTIDVVIGGPPCQGFSLIGHRILEDPRNALVFHFVRIVRELRPRYFVLENVPGMVTGGHTQLFDELIRRFRTLKYTVHSKVLNAAFFGVPQNRSRVFIIGSSGRNKVPDFPELLSALRNVDGSRKSNPVTQDLPLCPSVQDAIGDLPNIDDWETLLETDEVIVSLPACLRYPARLRNDVHDPEDFSYPRSRPPKVLTGCMRAEHTALSRKRFAATEQGDTEPVSRFFKLPWKGVSNTLRSGTATDRGAFTSPRPIHPSQARCISVREAARLHSYPDWFWFHQTKWHGFRQIGNSVPPLLGRAVAREIIKALGITPSRPSTILPFNLRPLLLFNMQAAARHFGVDAHVIPQRIRK